MASDLDAGGIGPGTEVGEAVPPEVGIGINLAMWYQGVSRGVVHRAGVGTKPGSAEKRLANSPVEASRRTRARRSS